MYEETFFGLCALCIILSFVLRQIPSSAGLQQAKGAEFKRFQSIYLGVYLLLMTGDWLQGPYVYALYQMYNFDTNSIAILFIAGFLSSAILGTLVGSVADTIGRKRVAALFCVVYTLSCFTKFSPNFYVLLLGRILAGIATSLLCSVPEAWMVCEHNKMGFSEELMAETFAWATWGNGLVAIVSGVLANYAADLFGIVAPFMVAVMMFTMAMVLILAFWGENYGQVEKTSLLSSLQAGLAATKADVKILSIGLIQSLFEGAMYSWVFVWTPTLQRGLSFEEQIGLPFGWIFAAFMVAVMIGSMAFSSFSKRIPPELLARPVYLAGAVMLLIPVLSNVTWINFASFLGFEFICGIHWPLVGILKGRYIPEDSRSSVMNLIRVPLNLIVVVVLLKVADMALETVFVICFLLVLVCFGFTFTLPLPVDGTKWTV